MPKVRLVQPALEVAADLAVVGSSANVLGKGFGPVIDASGDVVRFNRAVTDGFEEHVGHRTTVRVTNQHVFACEPFERWSVDTDFVRKVRDTALVLMGPKSDGVWESRDAYVHPSCRAYRANYPEAISTVEPLLGSQPSVGFAFIWCCLLSGIKPKVFGFGIGEQSMTHYWAARDNDAPFHKFSRERELLVRWRDEGLLTLHV
jgi:hypothetical protein